MEAGALPPQGLEDTEAAPRLAGTLHREVLTSHREVPTLHREVLTLHREVLGKCGGCGTFMIWLRTSLKQ